MTPIEFGPYTPQELEVIVEWLKAEKAVFEVIRNDQDEKEALMNDPRNVVNLAELRLNVYLAQIYYIKLDQDQTELVAAYKKKFGLEDESYGSDRGLRESLKAMSESEENALSRRRLAQNKVKKATWSWLAVVFLFLFTILHMLYNYITRK